MASKSNQSNTINNNNFRKVGKDEEPNFDSEENYDLRNLTAFDIRQIREKMQSVQSYTISTDDPEKINQERKDRITRIKTFLAIASIRMQSGKK